VISVLRVETPTEKPGSAFVHGLLTGRALPELVGAPSGHAQLAMGFQTSSAKRYKDANTCDMCACHMSHAMLMRMRCTVRDVAPSTTHV